MEYLPRDVKYELLEKMTYPELMKMCQVSKDFGRICQQEDNLIRIKYVDYMKHRVEMDYKIDLENFKKKYGHLPSFGQLGSKLILSSYYGRPRNVDFLIDQGVDPTALDNLAIIWASKNGHLPVVERLLLDERTDPSALYNFAIRSASVNGHLPVVERLLLDERTDPAAQRNEAIRYASESGHLPVVERLLLDPRVNPADQRNYAIAWASKNGHLPVVERLLLDPRVRSTLSAYMKDQLSSKRKELIKLARKNKHFEVVDFLQSI